MYKNSYCTLIFTKISKKIMSAPIGVCLKVAELRKRGYSNLAEWRSTPGNVQVTRAGRVFIYADDKSKTVLTYPSSKWANPFKVSQYGLQGCLERFEAYLLDMLDRDEHARQRFLQLADVNELGCYCAPDSACHSDIIIKHLNLLTKK